MEKLNGESDLSPAEAEGLGNGGQSPGEGDQNHGEAVWNPWEPTRIRQRLTRTQGTLIRTRQMAENLVQLKQEKFVGTQTRK